MARAALALLTSPGRLNTDFTITGDEAISYDQVAERISEACGRRITHTHISSDELVERFLARGLPEATARFRAFGYQGIAGGLAPTTFRAFAKANSSVWIREQPAKKT